MTQFVCVKTFRTRAEAELARGSLEAAGIQATVRADDAGGTEPALILTTGGAKVLVALADAARAKACIGVQTSSQKNS